MQVTHYGHSCLLLDTGDARILLDPGAFSSGFESVRDLTAVLITHQHYDHIDTERLPDLLKANPGARLVVDPGTVQLVEKLGLNAVTARSGDAFELDGTSVTVVGGQHARIHADIRSCPTSAICSTTAPSTTLAMPSSCRSSTWPCLRCRPRRPG